MICLKKLIIDFRTSEEEKNTLIKLGYNFLICPPSEKLYEAVCGHPDMLLHIMDNKIIVHKDIPKDFLELISSLGLDIVYSHSSIVSTYPKDIILNAVSVSNLFLHYTDYSDKNLINLAINSGKRVIRVKQGYTKCSTALVNDRAIITSDKGIATAFKDETFDVLLLPPGDIDLPGLDYGFIGGACGLIDENILAFYGDLEYYAYGKDVLSFLKKHKVEPLFLYKGKLIDRGSILSINHQ